MQSQRDLHKETFRWLLKVFTDCLKVSFSSSLLDASHSLVIVKCVFSWNMEILFKTFSLQACKCWLVCLSWSVRCQTSLFHLAALITIFRNETVGGEKELDSTEMHHVGHPLSIFATTTHFLMVWTTWSLPTVSNTDWCFVSPSY